jgi:phospholipid/cholesterol/gamma-HCH transport system substrate-binding protein
VDNIRVVHEKGDTIELTLSVYSDTVIKEDTKAAIKTLGIVGGKYVELSGGSPQSRMLETGGMIIGQESLKLEDLTRMAVDVVAKLNNMATNLDRMLGDPKMSKSLRTTIQNLQEASENIKVMTSSKDEVAQGLKELPAILKKTDDILKKTEDVANNVKAVTEKSDKILGENKKNIDEMLASFRDMAKNLKDISEDVKEHPWKLIRKP